MESKITYQTLIANKLGATNFGYKLNILLGFFIFILFSFSGILFNTIDTNISYFIILGSVFFIQFNIILLIFHNIIQKIQVTSSLGVSGTGENTIPAPSLVPALTPRSVSYRTIVLGHDASLSVIDGKLMDVLISLEKYESEKSEAHSIKNSVYQYAHNKAQFLEIKDIFLLSVAQDTKNIGVSLEELIKLTDTITTFRKSLASLADHILYLTPIDPFHIFQFPEPGIFREMLFEENSWIEGEALSMLAILKEWLVIHTEEIKGEKEKLMNLLKNEDSHIEDVLKITKSIHEQTAEKIQVRLS